MSALELSNAVLQGPSMGVSVLCVFLRFLSVDVLEDRASPGCSKCQVGIEQRKPFDARGLPCVQSMLARVLGLFAMQNDCLQDGRANHCGVVDLEVLRVAAGYCWGKVRTAVAVSTSLLALHVVASISTMYLNCSRMVLSLQAAPTVISVFVVQQLAEAQSPYYQRSKLRAITLVLREECGLLNLS